MGHILRVVTDYNLLENITRLIFTHTSTIDIKYYELKSVCMNKGFNIKLRKDKTLRMYL